jgi:hypothetical protein
VPADSEFGLLLALFGFYAPPKPAAAASAAAAAAA